jgi:hypothetical protein
MMFAIKTPNAGQIYSKMISLAESPIVQCVVVDAANYSQARLQCLLLRKPITVLRTVDPYRHRYDVFTCATRTETITRTNIGT